MRCNSGTRTLQLALIQPHRAHPASVDICGERWTLKKGRDAKMITRLHDVADLRRRVGGTANRHEEWLIDEASRDSFPASDPASSTQPGSIVNERYADAARERETVWYPRLMDTSIRAILAEEVFDGIRTAQEIDSGIQA